MKINKIFTTTVLSSLILSSIAGLPTSNFADELTTISERNIQEKLPDITGQKFDSGLLSQYKVIGKSIDKVGQTHYTLQQIADGIAVDNSEVKVHVNSEGLIVGITGKINENKISLADKVTVSENRASDIAKDKFGSDAQVYQQKQYVDADGSPFWVVKVASSKDVNKDAMQYKISSSDGSIIEEKSAIQHEQRLTPVNSTGIKQNGKRVQFKTLADNYYGVNLLWDAPHNESENKILDSRTQNNFVHSYNNQFNDSAAVDAFVHGQEVYNYYRNEFNIKGVNGKKAPLIAIVHDNEAKNNAFWNPGTQTMHYGEVDRTGVALSAAKDVVGHEITHGFINNSCDLEYSNQSGALNESLADTFGYFVDPGNWTMGEDANFTIRDLSNPGRFNQPDHMSKYRNMPNTEEGDHGGVHINSGIMNKAAYNIIQSIGKEKAQQIYFTVMQHYLNKNSDFEQMRNAMVQASKALYKNDPSVAIAVNNGYAAVGIGQRINNISKDNTAVNKDVKVIKDGSVSKLDFEEFSGMKQVTVVDTELGSIQIETSEGHSKPVVAE
ncbi:M4 family metallopeptidase [Peptostreptococcus faecalis]|uniref:M4 family metallopeptidase n=1 Tax=Peptostreptococcus faecalis TaxID=2045015 RepID=UPI000C7C7A58|nr:M4 family metallopeptidase [Peptostreptococcus faecalis]